MHTRVLACGARLCTAGVGSGALHAKADMLLTRLFSLLRTCRWTRLPLAVKVAVWAALLVFAEWANELQAFVVFGGLTLV
jgi:hypothetical protein